MRASQAEAGVGCTRTINQTFYRLRLIALIAVTTGMRVSEIFGLGWADAMYSEGLWAVRAKLKGGKMRSVPMLPELAGELRRFPAVIDEDRIFPPEPGATSGRQRVEGSFDDLLERAAIKNFRFHDLRRTFASWFMMNGGDLYELAKGRLEYQDERTLGQAGAATHCQDWKHGAGDLETNGRDLRQGERGLTMFA